MAKASPNSTPDQSKAQPTHDGEDLGIGAMTWLGTAWMEAMADLSSEMANFIAERIQEDVKTQHEILHCKSVTELRAVQAAFLERAYVQYTVETGRIIEKSAALFPNLTQQTKHTPI